LFGKVREELYLRLQSFFCTSLRGESNDRREFNSTKQSRVICLEIASKELLCSASQFLLAMTVILISSQSIAQQTSAADSLHTPNHYIDSLLKLDSIDRAMQMEDERRFQRTKQLATQRELDLTGDSIPEVFRLEGYVKGKVDDTRLTFTIKSKGKMLFEDSWLAKGYFDTTDHLPDSIKLKRLRAIVTVFFANENFEVVDSNDFNEMLKQVSEADVHPHSSEASEIFSQPRVMFSVYHSRDYWYGLIWNAKHKFVKAWRN
jgi:hypothetical protein